MLNLYCRGNEKGTLLNTWNLFAAVFAEEVIQTAIYVALLLSMVSALEGSRVTASMGTRLFNRLYILLFTASE